MKVPTYDSQEGLNPTPINPESAAMVGNAVADVGKGLQGIGEMVQKLDEKRQTYKAQAYLAQQHRSNLQLAATDPDIDGLTERISTNTTNSINEAANMIQNPQARNTFIERSQYQQEVRNVPIYNTILRRKSQDVKNSLIQANDEDIQTYTQLADPAERHVVKQGIIDRTDQAIADGHVNAQWAKSHVDTLLKQADHKQVEDDMSIDAEATYQALQKGADGLYPDLSPYERQHFADKAQKLIAKQGAENNMIYAIAQNHTENTLIDRMSQGQLTQEDINNSQLFGVNGIKSRPEFAKAATQALNDPFPKDPAPEKYRKLFDMVTDPDVDASKVKLDILNSRGLTPQQKAHLINASLREDPGQGRQSLNQLIQTGVQKNKQQILELNRQIQDNVDQKRTFLGQINELFKDHAEDDKHLSSLQQKLMTRLNDSNKQETSLEAAQGIMNDDTIARNPGIASSSEKGTLRINKITGEKRIYFPNGKWITTDKSSE